MTFIPSKNTKISFFDEQVNVEKKTLFVSEPVAGAVVSLFRDDVITTNSGNVQGSADELVVSTGSGSNSSVTLKTKRRAQYIPGFEMEVGLGVRIPTPPSGTQNAQWGYFDNFNGFGFGVDVTGSFLFSRRAGTDTKIYQSNWNKDTVNGSGSSGLVLDFTKGIITQINFTWYGYGDANYFVYLTDSGSLRKRRTLVHNIITEGSTSIETPNQPIRIDVDNGSAGGDFKVFVGGRLTATYGNSTFLARRFASYVTGVNVTSSATPTPLISIGKKQLFGSGSGNNNTVQVKLDNMEFSTNQGMLFDVVYSLSSSIDSNNFTTPDNIPAGETAVYNLKTGSNPTGDIYTLDAKIVQAGTSIFVQRFVNVTEQQRVILGDDDYVTIRARHLGTAGVVNAVIEWEEEW